MAKGSIVVMLRLLEVLDTDVCKWEYRVGKGS